MSQSSIYNLISFSMHTWYSIFKKKIKEGDDIILDIYDIRVDPCQGTEPTPSSSFIAFFFPFEENTDSIEISSPQLFPFLEDISTQFHKVCNHFDDMWKIKNPFN